MDMLLRKLTKYSQTAINPFLFPPTLRNDFPFIRYCRLYSFLIPVYRVLSFYSIVKIKKKELPLGALSFLNRVDALVFPVAVIESDSCNNIVVNGYSYCTSSVIGEILICLISSVLVLISFSEVSLCFFEVPSDFKGSDL